GRRLGRAAEVAPGLVFFQLHECSPWVRTSCGRGRSNEQVVYRPVGGKREGNPRKSLNPAALRHTLSNGSLPAAGPGLPGGPPAGAEATAQAPPAGANGHGEPAGPADWHAEAGRKGARRVHQLIQRGLLYEQEHGLKRGRQRLRQLIELGKLYEQEHGLGG